MNISNEIMIDAALNILGFILAGCLMGLIYSSLFKRSTSRNTVATARASVEKSKEAGMTNQENSRIEFVDFKGNSKNTMPAPVVQSPYPHSKFQQNRLEVIKQAREMLSRSGATRTVRGVANDQ